LCSNPLGKLIHLRHKGTVAKFHSKFLSLLACCEGLDEKHQINIFTVGLGNPLKTDVELEHPASLEEAMALARAYEQRLSMTELLLGRPLPRSTPNRTPGSGRQLLLPTPTTATQGGKDATPAPPRFKRLTTAEMVAKREKGECYNCTEQFSQEQDLPDEWHLPATAGRQPAARRYNRNRGSPDFTQRDHGPRQR
jgi:hypothetical protein